MRQRVLAVVGFVASALLVLAASCALERRTSCESTSESKDHGELTTGTPAAGEEVAAKTFTANEFCAACHYAFGEEELAANHEKAGIGCERCHGESERHRSDEDNVTPPEIMYPEDKINPTCMMCHPRHEIEHVGAHKKLLAGAKTIFDSDSDDDSPLVTCTSCHAKMHRMSVRSIRWNKATGELLDE